MQPHDQDEFVETALRLGQDPAWYNTLSKRVLARLPDATTALGHVSGRAWLRLFREVAEGKTPTDLYAPKSRTRRTALVEGEEGACDAQVVPLPRTLDG